MYTVLQMLKHVPLKRRSESHGTPTTMYTVLQMLKHVSIHTDTNYNRITLAHISLLIWITDLF